MNDLNVDKRFHLEIIQNVISRMAMSSASVKTWLMPVVLAAYGFATVEHSTIVAVLGLVAVFVFSLLDANYLYQERSFRDLYSAVANDDPRVKAFAVNPSFDKDTAMSKPRATFPPFDVWRSWAIAPFYGVLAITGILITAWTIVCV